MPLMRRGEEVREANSPYIIQSLKAHGFKDVTSEDKKPRRVRIPVKNKSKASKVAVRVK